MATGSDFLAPWNDAVYHRKYSMLGQSIRLVWLFSLPGIDVAISLRITVYDLELLCPVRRSKKDNVDAGEP